MVPECKELASHFSFVKSWEKIMSQKKKVPRLTKSFIEFAKWRFTAMQVNQYRIGKSLVAIIILFTLISFSTPLFAQGEPQSGSAKSIQDSAQISQLRGVDQRVDYQSLTRYGPWDDRNYGVTREDLSLIPEKDQYLQNVPVFFKIFLRKEQPNLGEFYPRSALQRFQILHCGLLVNGILYKEGLGIDCPSSDDLRPMTD